MKELPKKDSTSIVSRWVLAMSPVVQSLSVSVCIRTRSTVVITITVILSSLAVAAELPFDPDTGLRIHHYTSPVPSSVPGGTTLNTAEVVSLLDGEDVVLLDVIPINDVRYDELDGSWPDYPERMHIEGSLWLPNVGYGRPADDMQEYLLARTTEAVLGNLNMAVLVYCVSDCWMGWNVVQHLSNAGFQNIYWYPEGTDGWENLGLPLTLAEPVPVNVD